MTKFVLNTFLTLFSYLLFVILVFLIFDFYKQYRFDLKDKTTSPLFSFHAQSLFPYVSGNDFILNSKYVLDDYVNNLEINIKNIQDGDVLFVKTDAIGKFFHRYYNRIDKHIIIVSHTSDFSAGPNFKKYLNGDKIIAWFTQNPGFVHDKLVPLPIGLENVAFSPDKEVFIKSLDIASLIAWPNRNYSIYINYNSKNNLQARSYLPDYYRNINIKNMLIVNNRTNFSEFMKNIGNSKYVLCPRGNGLDTHRVYESILMGSIPIVENSTLYSIYKRATVLVVDNFKSVTQHMLDNPHLYIQNMEFSRSILWTDTWIQTINSYRMNYFNKKAKKK